MISDIEAANIARQYAEDPLLRNFPIPKIKLNDIELTIPVAVNDLSSTRKTLTAPSETRFSANTVFVTVETDKLQEKKSDSLLYIKLKLSEDALEWTTTEDEQGNKINKLTPY